jgi:hypothetical protein
MPLGHLPLTGMPALMIASRGAPCQLRNSCKIIKSLRRTVKDARAGPGWGCVQNRRTTARSCPTKRPARQNWDTPRAGGYPATGMRKRKAASAIPVASPRRSTRDAPFAARGRGAGPAVRRGRHRGPGADVPGPGGRPRRQPAPPASPLARRDAPRDGSRRSGVRLCGPQGLHGGRRADALRGAALPRGERRAARDHRGRPPGPPAHRGGHRPGHPLPRPPRRPGGGDDRGRPPGRHAADGRLRRPTDRRGPGLQPTPERRAAFAHRMRETLGIPVQAVERPEAAVEGADILITITSLGSRCSGEPGCAPGST